MNPNETTTNADDFRVVDLFSPSEERSTAPASPTPGKLHTAPPRVGGRMPSSFVFANPLFAPAREVRRKD